MALSELEKVKVLRLLGWSAKTLDSTSTSYSKIISDRLENLSAATLAEVAYFLDRLDKLETRLDSAISRAGIKSIDDIELFGDEFTVLRKEKTKLIRELSVLLDIFIVGASSAPSQGCVVV
jgi:hypothetical protein